MVYLCPSPKFPYAASLIITPSVPPSPGNHYSVGTIQFRLISFSPFIRATNIYSEYHLLSSVRGAGRAMVNKADAEHSMQKEDRKQ